MLNLQLKQDHDPTQQPPFSDERQSENGGGARRAEGLFSFQPHISFDRNINRCEHVAFYVGLDELI